MICLLCKDCFCQNCCNEEKHKKHNVNKLNFDFSSGYIRSQTKYQYENAPIYVNDFKMNFDPAQTKKEVYNLDEIKF